MRKKIIVLTSIVLIILVVLILFKTDIKYFIKGQPLLYKYAKKGSNILKLLSDKPDQKVFTKDVKREVSVKIDVEKSLGAFDPFFKGIGMGTFHDGVLKSYNQSFFELLKQTNEKASNKKFVYLNMKGIFMDAPHKGIRDDGAHIYIKDQDGKINYHWKIVDAVLDKVVHFGLRPIITFIPMPQELASDIDRKNPWNKGIVSPPNDYRLWRELLFQTIRHLTDRYGSSEIETWYFEIWNEPDLFSYFWIPHPDERRYPKRSDFSEYCKLYDYAVDGAVSANPNIKIGGPALAGDVNIFFEKFLMHCFHEKNHATGKKGTRVDFISRHHYGKIEERIIPKFKQFIDKGKDICGPSFKNLDVLITETGPTAVPESWLNTRYVAAWM